MKKKVFIICGTVILILGIIFIYIASAYRAEDIAKEYLISTKKVKVSETDFGWYFDGPSEEYALCFYPGAKVEEIAYAPLLFRLAESGMDVCLVDMPLNLALLGVNKADSVIGAFDYSHWYVGGHSLGGAMSAIYASKRGKNIDGVILCAAYPTRKLDDNLEEIVIYGSEDKIMDMDNLEKSIKYAPEDHTEYVIEGGNHSQFGNYGFQAGDGNAFISAADQQSETIQVILDEVR